MSCPTCGHTMNCILESTHDNPGIFVCPRCGTVHDDDAHIYYVPKLVDRCREFQKTMNDEQMDVWDFYDIPDCLNLPENRI